MEDRELIKEYYSPGPSQPRGTQTFQYNDKVHTSLQSVSQSPHKTPDTLSYCEIVHQSSKTPSHLEKEDTNASNIETENEEIRKNGPIMRSGSKEENKRVPGSTGKKTKAVKKNTEHGNEYQRLIQVLLRQRGLQKAGFRLGTEIPGVGSLDDIVFMSDNSVRFFQVKSSKSDLSLSSIFKVAKKQEQKGRPNFELIQYFESFCEIKKNERFFNMEVEELSLLTNQRLKIMKKDEKYKKYLKEDDLENDYFLNLTGQNVKKYALKVEALRENEEIIKPLEAKYNNLFPEKPEKANEIINEYLEKIHYIIEYPGVDDLKYIISKEIFLDYIIISDTLMSKLIHFEIEHLSSRGKEEGAEFLTNEMWNKELEKVKNSIKKSEESRFTQYNIKKLASRYLEFEFDHDTDRIREIYKDITTLLNNSTKSILNFTNVVDEDFATINITKILDHVREKELQEMFLNKISLLEDEISVEQFLSGEINVLVVSGSVPCMRFEFRELANKLIEGLKNSKQKIILVSASETSFTSLIKELAEETYLEKQFEFDFSCLDKKSKSKILATKEVEFQGQKIFLGALFGNDLNFAQSVIDENILSKITQREEAIKILDKNSFESPGYNEEYYVRRELYRNEIELNQIKDALENNLFFITFENRLENHQVVFEMLKIFLKEKEKYLQVWPNKPKKGERKFENNGIMLGGVTSESDEAIFKEITKQNITVHWILLRGQHYFHLDSRNISIESTALQTIPPTYKEDSKFCNLLQSEKTIIFVGDSGVGKSTVLTRIANEIRSGNESAVWILRVNLRTFYRNKTLDKVGDTTKVDTAVSLIADMTSYNNSSEYFKRKIIEEGLKDFQKQHFKIVLMFDGFNEISFSYRAKTCNLIKTLISKCNVKKIFITSQIQEKVKLESELNVPAYYLRNLDHENQVKLMVNYWKTKQKSNTPINNDILKKDAERALQVWNSSIKEEGEKTFTEVSLNLIMLADVFLTKEKIDENIDLCSLYEKFITKKFSMYTEETSEHKHKLTEVDQVKEQIFQYSIREILQEESVRIIFMTYVDNYLDEIKKLPNIGALNCWKRCAINPKLKGVQYTILSKIGILSIKEEIDFTHYSFAQYFFSEYFVENLHEYALQHFFVKHVLTQDHLYLCRKFLNNFLQKRFKDGIEDTLSEGRAKELPVKNKRIFRAVSQLTKESLDFIIIFLLSILKRQDKKKTKSSFLEDWAKNELPIFKGITNKKLLQDVTDILKEIEFVELPDKIRTIISIDKTHDDDETKRKNIISYINRIRTNDSH